MRLSRLVRNRALGLVRRLAAPMRARDAARGAQVVRLEDVRHRLELLLAAMYGRRLDVRDERARTGGLGEAPGVVLPAVIKVAGGAAGALLRYRVLAIQQAERLARGTHDHPVPVDPVERDLYRMIEGAAVDQAIVRRSPGLSAELARLHRAELAGRPPLHRLGEVERAVETALRARLAASLLTDDGEPLAASPAESLARAREEARRIRAAARSTRYRGIRGVVLWELDSRAPTLKFDDGNSLPLPVSSDAAPDDGDRKRQESTPDHTAPPQIDSTAEIADDAGDRDAGGPTTTEHPATHAEDAAPRRGGGVRYDEWDLYADRYRAEEVTVHVAPGEESDGGWAAQTLAEQAALVRQVRARFAPLRAQRVRLRAQRSGDDLDLDRCIEALTDLRAGRAPDDRLYELSRPARRTLAILLLADVSGSTKQRVSHEHTVLDVERLTLLLACEALDALHDAYAVQAFSGSGRHDVRVATIKSFRERDPDRARRRISALRSGDNTRLGAAIRHGTATLNAHPAERRLLLLLSDGQPNDVGGYQGDYGLADSHRAVVEARDSGVHFFCLTVDREEPEYLPRLFGAGGYRIMREPEQLPLALLHVVARLLPR
jgi:nitric oxide reductase NorD protein